METRGVFTRDKVEDELEDLETLPVRHLDDLHVCKTSHLAVGEVFVPLPPLDQVDALDDGLRIFEATRRIVGLEWFLSAIKGSAHLQSKIQISLGLAFLFRIKCPFYYL